MASGIRSALISTQELTFTGGINVTSNEYVTEANQLSAGLNVFTDTTGSVYNRRGSVLAGGIVSSTGVLGTFLFRDNEMRQEIVVVIDQIIYHLVANTLVPVQGSPSFPSKVPVYGTFFPDVDKYILVNGKDPAIVLSQASGSLTAVIDNTIPVCANVLYHNRFMLYLGILGTPNIFRVSNPASILSNPLSNVALEGSLIGGSAFNLSLSIIVTDQRAYRIGDVSSSVQPDTTLSYAPGSFDLGPLRGLAPRSIVTIKNAVFCLGLDAQNGMEIYRIDGQRILPVAGSKLQYYQQFINTSALSNACATPYGPYYKVAVPPSGSVLNTDEWLLDTSRSDFQSVVTFEPRHQPGFGVAAYCLYTTSGADYVLAADQSLGCLHREGVGVSDELLSFNTLAPTSSGAPVVCPVGSMVGQPLTFTNQTVLTTVSVAFQGPVNTAVAITLNLTPTNPDGTPSTINGVGYPPSVTQTFQTSATGAGIATFSIGQFTVPPQKTVVLAFSSSVSVSFPTAQPVLLGNAYLFTNQAWALLTQSLQVVVATLQDIVSYAVHTTSLGDLQHKKKPVRTLVSGSSILGSVVQLGIGLEGRDSIFQDKPIVLSGNASLWAGNSLDIAPPHLIWDSANDIAPAANNRWSSLSTSYLRTIFAPQYVRPSTYLSYRIYHKGQADWRINTYTPMVNAYPTTIL